MIRGKGLREFDSYFREPYTTIINLFVRMENPKLTSQELRYILLKYPNLSRIKRFKSEQEKISEPKYIYDTKVYSLERIRSAYKHRLKTILPGSRFKYMSSNGLNLTLKRMRKKIIKYKHKKYSLTPNFYEYYTKRDPNSVLQQLLKRNLTYLRKNEYALYYPSVDNVIRTVVENQQELSTLTKKIQTAKLKLLIGQLINEMKEDRKLCSDWVLVGCIFYQLTDQIKRVPYLDVSDFQDELNQIMALLTKPEKKINAEQFSVEIEKTLTTFNQKLKLNETQENVVKEKYPWMMSKEIRISDAVSGVEWKHRNTESVNELVELGIISKNDYVIYRNQNHASLYLSKLGFEKYLNWSFLNNPPQIILDFGY